MMPKCNQRYGFDQQPDDINTVSDVHTIINPEDLERLSHVLNVRSTDESVVDDDDDDNYTDEDIETNPDDVFTVEGSRTKTSSEVFGQHPSRQLGQHQQHVVPDFTMQRSVLKSMPLPRNQYQVELPFSSQSTQTKNDDKYSDVDEVDDIETNPDDVFTVEGSRTKTSSEVFGQHPSRQLGQHQQQGSDFSIQRSGSKTIPLSTSTSKKDNDKSNNNNDNKLYSSQRNVGSYWYYLRKSNPVYSSSPPSTKPVAIDMSPDTTLTHVEEAPPIFRLPEKYNNKRQQITPIFRLPEENDSKRQQAATDEYPSFIMIDGKPRRQHQQSQRHDKHGNTRSSTFGQGNDSKISVWKKDICGIRADQFILFWILILLISVVVIVVAMVLSVTHSSSVSSSSTANSTDKQNNPTANQDNSPVQLTPTMAPTNESSNQQAHCKTIVADDSEVEFPNGNGSFIDCMWLSNHPEAHALLCVPDRAAYEFCPLTCQNCDGSSSNWPTKECGEDDLLFEFTTGPDQRGNCAWLANLHSNEINNFCKDFDIFMFCRETCRNCGPVIPSQPVQTKTKTKKPSTRSPDIQP